MSEHVPQGAGLIKVILTPGQRAAIEAWAPIADSYCVYKRITLPVQDILVAIANLQDGRDRARKQGMATDGRILALVANKIARAAAAQGAGS